MLNEYYTLTINSLIIYSNELGDIGKKTRDIMVILAHNPNTYIIYSLSLAILWSKTALNVWGCDGLGVYGASMETYGQLEFFETR